MTDTRPQDFWQFLLDEEAHTKLIMRDWRAARYDCITYLNNMEMLHHDAGERGISNPRIACSKRAGQTVENLPQSSGSPSHMPGSGGATPLATTCPALQIEVKR